MTDTAQAEIRALIEERLSAIRDKDAHGAMRSIAEDVVVFEMVPPLALLPGSANDEQAFAAWLSGFDKVSVEVRDLVIEADERVAFAHALHHLVGVRVGGAPLDLWLRSTLCFRHDGGAWKIVHAHSSVPFYPGPELKAAVDLKPQ